ncbi:MAG TPA: glycosyltransferase family 87 protein [Candidatus Sulfotelmatobacter sp.]
MPLHATTRRNRLRIFAALLLLAGAGEFLVRGPIRFVRSAMVWNDFLSPYIQASAWAHGKDPYSAASIVLLWPSGNPQPDFIAREAANGTLPARRGIPSLYPVTSLVLLGPFVSLKWSTAETLWIALNTTALLVSLLALVAISGASWRSLRVQFFIAAALALAPLHTGLATGNPAVLAIALTIAAVWAACTGRDTTCGILLALAICLKPTIAFALLFYYVLRRRWKIAAVAATLTALITAVAASWLTHERVAWIASYIENNRKILAPGGLADFTSADPLRFNLVNTQVLFYSLLGSISLAQWLSLFLPAALFAIWLLLYVKRKSQSPEVVEREFLEISALFVLSLLPVYHRFYDAGLLLWPLAWALLVANLRRRQLLTMLVILPFFVPGAALLDRLTQQGRVPASIARSGWWNRIVMPHEIWSLISLSIMLLFFMRTATHSANTQPATRIPSKRPEILAL